MIERITPRPILRDARDYAGVVMDGTTDSSDELQAAVDNLATLGGGILAAPEGGIRATGITWPSRVKLRGVLGQTEDATSGTTIIGTAGSDTIIFPTGTSYAGFEDLTFVGGRDQLVLQGLTIESTLNGVVFAPDRAAVHIPAGAQASIERWAVRDVHMVGGEYGWWHEFVDGVASTCYMDKMLFENVLAAGQSKNAWNVQTVVANSNTWNRCGMSHVSQHGAVFKGGFRSAVFVDFNTEANGKAGKHARTTGSVTNGSPTLTVGSTAGFAVGDPLVVAAAGNVSGGDHYTTVQGIGTGTITMTDPAGRTVAGAEVTNASWDDFLFGATGGGGAYTPALITFHGGVIGGEATDGRLRYSINAQDTFGVGLFGAMLGRPVYDPGRTVQVFGGEGQVRQPPTHAGDLWRYTTFAPPGAGSEFFRTLIASPPGRDTVLGLRDSLETSQGTFGGVEVRRGDPNKTRLFRVDGASGEVLIGSGALYVDSGALKYRSPGGTVTTIAPA